MKIAIHQPNFFPWLGYFDKIQKSDLFIYLDHVENNPRDSGWFKSVKILVTGNEHWITQPLVRPDNVSQQIREMVITEPRKSLKILKTIKLSYGKAPYFDRYFDLIENYFNDSEEFICERNIKFIDNICSLLQIKTPKKRSSEFNWSTSGTELILDIMKKYEGTTYLVGGGSTEYFKPELLLSNGINVEEQNFIHPDYTHFNADKKYHGLSVIDALFNIGHENLIKLIKNSD